MAYLVHSSEERSRMLEAVGAASMDDLLSDVPGGLRIRAIELPDGLSEFDTLARVRQLADRNRVYADRLTFRGGGVYRRFVPAGVDAVISKPEFYTAYTPYQPEASQGTLQAIFEFQTAIAELTGLDVANASLYDGATALAEAAMMAAVHTGREEVLVLSNLHPEYLEVLRCYAEGRGFRVRVGGEPDAGTAAILFQNPDFLGLIHSGRRLADQAHAAGALLVACVDPVSLALLAPPGEYGADIAVGEGQQLGMAASYGGPHLGFIACRADLVRRLPGRLVGQAQDGRGRRGFVLTLTAREQHIRRDKATSNICTNHSLCALAATAYLALLGPDGLRQVAEVSFQRAHHLAERLTALPGVELAFPGQPFLNEFAVRCKTWNKVSARLSDRGILGGLPVGQWFPERPELADVVTFACTEVNDADALDQLVGAVSEALS